MKMNKILTACLSGIIAVSMLGGCAAKTETPAAEKPAAEKPAAETGKEEAAAETPTEAPEEILIPVISKGFQHQFWQAVKMGAEQAGENYGVKITFEGPETEAQVDKQLDMLQAALAKKPQAICLAALDSKAAVPYLQKAQEAGIPVIGFDSGVDSEIVTTTCATDNYAAAAAAAHKMAELIGGEGKVGVVAHDQTSKTGTDRRDGFVKTLQEEYPNIQVLEVQYGDGDHAKSTEAAKAIITANPDIKGVFGTNEGSAVGVLNAAKELNKVGEITIIGFDSGKLLLDGIKSGSIAGAITQDPVGIGYKAVEAAYKQYKGEATPEFIDTGYKWYDKTNMEEPDIAAVLYE